MKKLIIGLGIAAMVMGMAVGANAASANWQLNLRAGLPVDANAATVNWTSSTGPCIVGIGTAAVGTYASFASTSVGIWVDNGQGVGNKQIKAAGEDTYSWALKLENKSTGPTSSIKLGWWVQSATYADLSGWTFKLYKGTGDNLTNEVVLASNGKVAGTAGYVQIFDTRTIARNAVEDYTLVATAVPEPGSMVAMLSGLAGLVGFGIRRRK